MWLIRVYDDVLANEAYYLLEHLNRMFSFMHRGLCLERIKALKEVEEEQKKHA
jgi:hypothetical protein